MEGGELTAEGSSTDNESRLVDSPRKEVEDYRIKCRNKVALDKLLNIAIDHVTKLADSQNLGDYSSQFVSNFTENFVQIMQEYLTVNGLPWDVKQGQQEEETRKKEMEKGLVSALTKKIELLAAKRKEYPKEIRKAYELKSRHEIRSLQVSEIKHDVAAPLPKVNPSPNLCKEYTEACQSLEAAQKQFRNALDEVSHLEEMESKVQDIVNRNKKRSLNDTGYLSE